MARGLAARTTPAVAVAGPAALARRAYPSKRGTVGLASIWRLLRTLLVRPQVGLAAAAAAAGWSMVMTAWAVRTVEEEMPT